MLRPKMVAGRAHPEAREDLWPLAKQEKEFVNTGIAHKQTDAGDKYEPGQEY